MFSRQLFLTLTASLAAILFASHAAIAQDRIAVVASFSILGDMVQEVGGDQVEVVTLVGADGDAHVYEPTPADAKALADAHLLVLNGLGFEAWLPRLVQAAGFNGATVTASDGITPLTWTEVGHDDHQQHADPDRDHGDEAHTEGDDHDHDNHTDEPAAEGHDHDHEAARHPDGSRDPHAWQSLANGVVYVRNIAHALAKVDPDHADAYRARAENYATELELLHRKLKTDFGAIPAERRNVVTSHDAFRYFGEAYGLQFIAPAGISTEAEASAGEVATIIDQIREQDINAVFVENITDKRLIEQITRETDASIGGELYSDALSGPDGPAPTYLRMFEHNASALLGALHGS